MYQTTIPVKDTRIVTVYFVQFEFLDVLITVMGAGTNHDRRACGIPPSTLRKLVFLFDGCPSVNIVKPNGLAFRMHLPCLIVCPRIVICLIICKRIIWRDKHVDIAFRCILNPSYFCYFLSTQRFLGFRLIYLAISLDMQIVFDLRIEGVDIARVIPICFLHHVFRAVASTHTDFCSHNHCGGLVRIERLCTRQIELIQSGRTYRAFNNEQVGILCSNVCFIFLNTARH